MPDTTPDQAAVDTTAALIRSVAGTAAEPADYDARARAYVLGGIIGADRVARSDSAFRDEVRVLLAALVAATAP
jgi:hypothetical protein